MSVELNFNSDAQKQLEQLSILVKYKATDACLREVGKVVAARARQIAPSSRQSGTRRKWSKKYKDNPRWDIDSGKHIGAKVIKTSNGGLVYIGGVHPLGNKLQFNNPKKKNYRNAVYWNRSRGTYVPQERIFDKAAAETVSQQQAAFVAALEKVLANG